MYTEKEKREYFASLRERWAKVKAAADNDPEARATYASLEAPEMRISYYGYYFCMLSMRALGYDGTPYIDCKTFNGWRAAGFIVRRGEHANIDGVTWIPAKDKEGKETETVYPKVYKLFHRSQVEAIV